jgi:hypothetical protein
MSAEGGRVFVLMFAVPALLVVVLGYAVGHGLWGWLGSLVDAAAGTSLARHAEVAGWITGLLLLAIATRIAVVLWRAWRRPPG